MCAITLCSVWPTSSGSTRKAASTQHHGAAPPRSSRRRHRRHRRAAPRTPGAGSGTAGRHAVRLRRAGEPARRRRTRRAPSRRATAWRPGRPARSPCAAGALEAVGQQQRRSQVAASPVEVDPEHLVGLALVPGRRRGHRPVTRGERARRRRRRGCARAAGVPRAAADRPQVRRRRRSRSSASARRPRTASRRSAQPEVVAGRRRSARPPTIRRRRHVAPVQHAEGISQLPGRRRRPASGRPGDRSADARRRAVISRRGTRPPASSGDQRAVQAPPARRRGTGRRAGSRSRSSPAA